MSVSKRKLNNNALKTTATSQIVTVQHLNHGLEIGNKVTITGATATGGISAASLNGARTVVAKDFTGYTFWWKLILCDHTAIDLQHLAIYKPTIF